MSHKGVVYNYVCVNISEERSRMAKTRKRRGAMLPGLRRARTRADLTQLELAQGAGVERAQVSNFENAKQGAYPLTVEKLSQALGVEPEELTTAPKDAPTLFPTEPAERSVVYLGAVRRLLDRMDRRLEEVIERDGADLALAEWSAQLERDVWERVVPEIRLMQIGGLSRDEAEAHELVYAALLGFGSSVQEAYKAASRKRAGQQAEVVGFDHLQAAMEERNRAREEGRQRIAEARSA